jgi:hypothetical protein
VRPDAIDRRLKGLSQIRHAPIEDLGFARICFHRALHC